MKYQTISLFASEGAIDYVTIASDIFTCEDNMFSYFHMWRYHVFAQKLTLYFIGVYVIKI